MLIARLAIAAGTLMALCACGTGQSAELEPSTTSPGSPTAAADRSAYRPDDGARKSIGGGVVLAITPPASFTPSDTAYPRVSRAVAFEIVLDNGSALVVRPAELSFLATVDGTPAEQVIDSTQGYPAAPGAADEVAPGDSVRFAVAFQVPERPCAVRLSVRQGTASPAAVELYAGRA